MAEHTPMPTPYRAVYGFAFFIFFKTLFILYLFWAFVPDHIIEETLGLTYLPDKYFALYIPILVLCALTVFGFFIYPAWNLSMQHDVDNVHTVQDCYSLNRCQHVNMHTGNICGRKVKCAANSTNHQTNCWHTAEFCELHDCNRTATTTDNDRSGVRVINNFCDCINKSECVLSHNPQHIDVLYAQNMVPNVCDMSIADVCNRLFRNKNT